MGCDAMVVQASSAIVSGDHKSLSPHPALRHYPSPAPAPATAAISATAELAAAPSQPLQPLPVTSIRQSGSGDSGSGPPHSAAGCREAECTIAAASELARSTNLDTGLTATEIDQRRTIYGWNETAIPAESLWLLFGRKFWGLSSWMLELVIVVSAALQRW